MKPSQLATALQVMMSADVPTHLWGAPGIGKSSIVHQVAKKLNLELRDIRAVLTDPVDWRGLPVVKNGRASWAMPDFLPHDPDSKGILFLDELNAAPPIVQAACYQLVLDRRLGDYRLPAGWRIVAAGNNEKDGAVVHRMSSALRSRFQHLQCEIDVSDWLAWALGANVRTEILAFIKFRPELLHKFARDAQSFPCPRTWEFASRILDSKAPADIELPLYTGTIGEGAAAELMAFLKVFRTLPSPDAIILDPVNAAVPTDPATLYAIAGALARRASDANFQSIVTYANRLPDELSVFLVSSAVRRDAAITGTRAFIQWGSDHKDVLV